MKLVLLITYIKALVLLSFNAYAQDDVRSSCTGSKEKDLSGKKHPIAQMHSSSQENSGNHIPDIRREVAIESVSLYPNPVVDQLLVDVDLNVWQGGTISIKSRSGRMIAQQRILDASMGFNLSSLNRGVYLLTVRKGGAEKTIEVIKL